MMLPGPPKERVELSFEPIHEGWSIYKTKDDVIIKMRVVVLHILLSGVTEDGNAQLALGFNLLFAVTAPQEVKGPLNSQPIAPEQVMAAIVERDVPFDTVKEDWNEYAVEGVKVGVKPVATVVSKSSLFDADGEPVYNVQYQAVIRAITKPEDKAKFQKIWAERQPAKTTGSGTPTKAP